MDTAEFRKELTRIMPGYSWTIHKSRFQEGYLKATGTQSAGSNRISTLEVEWRKDNNDLITYEVRSSGYGRRAPWLHEYSDVTLARALRGLQSHYESMANAYNNHANALKIGRRAAA